jgi:hypothetical protein
MAGVAANTGDAEVKLKITGATKAKKPRTSGTGRDELNRREDSFLIDLATCNLSLPLRCSF